jgi:hypothetical protein
MVRSSRELHSAVHGAKAREKESGEVVNTDGWFGIYRMCP